MSATTAREGAPSTGARITRAIARITAPLTRPLAGRRFFPLWAVLHHRGRRSGRAYAVPVAIWASPDTFTIPLPWGEATQWLRNVLAADGATLRWRGSDHRVSAPRVVPFKEAGDAFRPAHRALMRASGVRSFLHLHRDVADRPASLRSGGRQAAELFRIGDEVDRDDAPVGDGEGTADR